MKTACNINKSIRYTLVLFVLVIGFITTVGTGGGGGSYDLPENVYPGMYTSVAIDDLNGDGLSDIAAVHFPLVSYPHPSVIIVLLQNPLKPGSFQLSRRYAIGLDAWSIAIDDLNDDGLPDLAASNTLSNSISILFQNSAEPGKFFSAFSIQTGSYPDQVALGDINGDGLIDIAVSDSRTSIIFQDSNLPGTFFQATSLGFNSGSVAIGDLNADNLTDIAATNNPTGTVVVSLQNSTNLGEFLPETYFSSGPQPTHVSIGYIDGDLLSDLVVVNYGSPDASISARTSVLLQNPSIPGSFQAPENYVTGKRSDEAVIDDLNGDNLNDIVVVNSSTFSGWPGTVSVMLQDSSNPGTFNRATHYAIISGPNSVAVGDLNGDSFPDIAVVDDGVHVLFQNPNSPGKYFAQKRVGG